MKNMGDVVSCFNYPGMMGTIVAIFCTKQGVWYKVRFPAMDNQVVVVEASEVISTL